MSDKMNGIIEKLGTTAIESVDGANLCGGDWCDEDPVRELEQQNNEMLEALIEMCLSIEKYEDHLSSYDIPGKLYLSEIIEKADPKHRSWDEIKELLK